MNFLKRILNQLEYDFTPRKDIAFPPVQTVSIPLDGKTLFFKNGKMFKIVPDDGESWYDARYIVSDGILYDLENVNDLKRIPVPNFDQYCDIMDGYGITGSLDYVLRMKASNLYQKHLNILCSACLWKATELMLKHESAGWRKEDFNRLIYWHYELGMPKEAEKAIEFLTNFQQYSENTFDSCAKSIRDSVFKSSQKFGYDLVVFHDYGNGCCPECAKNRSRIFSISGKSKLYPKLPDYVQEHGNFHPGCRCTMSIYFEGDTVYYKGERKNALKLTFRPWNDDRTSKEKILYQNYLDQLEKQKIQEKKRIEYSIKKGIDNQEYEAILKLLPNLAPKSLTGYRRMKNAKTKNFINLVEKAKQAGININL